MRDAFVVVLAIGLLGCSGERPSPPPPERCLPVLEPCGDCVSDCRLLRHASDNRWHAPSESGQMGTPDRGHVLTQHCLGNDCRAVFRAPRGSCYGLCGNGYETWPECRHEGDSCQTVGGRRGH